MPLASRDKLNAIVLYSVDRRNRGLSDAHGRCYRRLINGPHENQDVLTSLGTHSGVDIRMLSRKLRRFILERTERKAVRFCILDDPAVVLNIKAIVGEVEEAFAVTTEDFTSPAPGGTKACTFDAEE